MGYTTGPLSVELLSGITSLSSSRKRASVGFLSWGLETSWPQLRLQLGSLNIWQDFYEYLLNELKIE